MTRAKRLQAVRGMRDILPGEADSWRRLEGQLADTLLRYGYRELRLPVLEKTALFARSLGQDTDVVNKEMYSFTDHNGESLTLRPEGTAGAVRAMLEHGLIHNQEQRIWYLGPMFRHERPQKGRQRQFHQLGVEAYGLAGPDIDAEMLALCARLWQQLGVASRLRLAINCLGTAASRRAYRATLVRYFEAHRARLDEDSLRRLATNPLRILDSSNPALRAVIAGAPGILEYLDPESRDHFNALLQLLEALAIPYHVEPLLMRGLDYYQGPVFEWLSDEPGAQSTICAGGRYDDLITAAGGRDSPALGFAVGLERLLALCHPDTRDADSPGTPHVYLISDGEDAARAALGLAEQLRDALPGLRALLHCGGGALRRQFKKADKSGAELALVLDSSHLEQTTVAVRFLRQKQPQQLLAQEQLRGFLAEHLGLDPRRQDS